jgi:LVIVD repeat
MRFALRLVLLTFVALGLLAGTAGAKPDPDPNPRKKMDKLFTSPNMATNSDFAFWGDHVFSGYYTGDTGSPPGSGPRGGVRIFDISDPAKPKLVRDFSCDANQNDPIVWDRNGNGVADLLLVAVDRTMANPNCGAPRSAHDDRNGWEGVRIFELSDNPANPFATITPVKMQYTDCGAHTITAWTGFAEAAVNPRLIVYVASYPLRAGPTCGQANFNNVTNPYDEDKVVNDPLHRQIQVLSVPLSNPAATTEIAAPEISYPGDPDGQMDWTEKGLTGLEPAAVACHDIAVHMEHNLAGAACAEQGQVWEIDPSTGIPDTENPISIGDDEVSSGGTGQFPGAVDFFHSVMFNNDGTVVNWVDESFGSGCPTMTTYQPRPWNPAGGTHKTGRMFFSDLDGTFLSEFHVGDLRPDPGADEYCSAHMGMTVMGIKKDLLVNAWYTGGVDVIDFSNPTNLKETAFYDTIETTGTWSAYPYTGPMFRKQPGIPVYASDGVENNALAEGMVVYQTIAQKPNKRGRVDHLNPQTMEMED